MNLQLKLCGLKRMEDIDYVNTYSPDYVGFIFAKSKRQVTPQQAQTLSHHLIPEIQTVGVFVNEPIANIKAIAEHTPLSVIQLHGDEDMHYIEQLKEVITLPIWKAVRVKTSEDILKADSLPVDQLLLDSYSKQVYGGSGEVVDFTTIKNCNITHPFFLAGGLNESNVLSAIKEVHPMGIDLSSGIETNGVKDKEKIKRIVQLINQWRNQTL